MHRVDIKGAYLNGVVTDNEVLYMQYIMINSILRRHSLDGLKPLSTYMDTQLRLTTDQAPASTAMPAVMRDVPYCEVVDALNCAVATLPDIAFPVATVARFVVNPGLAGIGGARGREITC